MIKIRLKRAGVNPGRWDDELFVDFTYRAPAMAILDLDRIVRTFNLRDYSSVSIYNVNDNRVEAIIPIHEGRKLPVIMEGALVKYSEPTTEYEENQIFLVRNISDVTGSVQIENLTSPLSIGRPIMTVHLYDVEPYVDVDKKIEIYTTA